MAYRTVFQNKTNRKNKYNAKGQEYNGKWYHSKKEAKYAEELDWRKQAGEIKDWKGQVKIELKVNDVLICNYYCDFKVINKHGAVEYHEVKGFATSEFLLKWKLLNALKNELLEPGAELLIIK